MSSSITRILLFGDENIDILPAIQEVLEYAKTSTAVETFIKAALETLGDQIEQGYPNEVAPLGSFEELLHRAERSGQSSQAYEVISGVCICIARLGELVFLEETEPSVRGTKEEPVNVLGFCAGEISGAVAVAARDVQETMQLGLEIIRVMFRFYQQMMNRTIEVDQSKGSWGVTVMGITQELVQEILDDFHDCEDIKYERQVCIGVVSEEWVTLVGCPTTMASLFEWSDEIGELARIDVFGRGSVHMYNLPALDLDTILGDSLRLNTAISSKAYMLSPYDCSLRQGKTLRELLREILLDVSQKPMHVSKVVRQAVECIENEEATLMIAGYSGQASLVQKELTAAGIDVYVVCQNSRSHP